MITETSKWLILNLLNLQIVVLNLALVLLHTGTAVSIYHLSPEVPGPGPGTRVRVPSYNFGF